MFIAASSSQSAMTLHAVLNCQLSVQASRPHFAGVLTKAQLQATLLCLGMLASKPPAFSSTVRSTTAMHPSTSPARHARQECTIVDRLWQVFTNTVHQSDSIAAMRRTKALALPASRIAGVSQHAGSDDATADKADSSDSLLSESLHLWQQLTGEADLSPGSAHADLTQPPKTPLQVSAGSPSHVVPLTMHTGESINSTANQQILSPQQHKEARKSDAHGVRLQQLLSFVQLVQQHSSGTGLAETLATASLQTSMSSQQAAELDKIACICSQHKQANMAYKGIGNSRVQQQLRGQCGPALKGPLGTVETDASLSDQHGVPTSRWQPQGNPFVGKRCMLFCLGFANMRLTLHC